MKSQTPYKKAPITEALIDLRVKAPPEIEVSKLKGVHDAIVLDYPNCDGLGIVQGQFQFSPDGTTTSTSNVFTGYRLSTVDQKQILQVRLDGFTFSRLEPYEGWAALHDEARRLWRIYIEVARPERIQRVAVRYINRLDLPLNESSVLDFKDYLKTVPEISPDLPQGLSDYVMQLQIPQNDLNALLILSQAILPTDKESTVSVLLDIDLFSLVDLPVDNVCWDLLEKLRTRKNEVFEACITDKTRELIR